MVALALLGFMSLLMLQGLAASRNLWGGATAQAAIAESIEGAQGLLRERLSHTFPSTRYDAPTPYPDFVGAANSLVFTAPLPAAAGPGALRRYSLMIDSSGDLVLTASSELWGRRSGPVTAEVLLRGVQGLDIAYLDAPADRKGRWRDQWFKEPAMPVLVRVRVRFPAGDRRWWPDLLVSPGTTIDADCVLDDGGARCAGRA